MSVSLAQIIDPRVERFPQPPQHPDLEFRSAVPLWGPWYQMSPWAWSDLPQESFYSPRSYPFPATNIFIPRRSGAFIQPGQADPLSYKLMFESGSLDGLGQQEQSGKAVKFAIGTWIVFMVLRSIVGAFIPKRKIRKLIRGVGPKGATALGLLAAGGLYYWFLVRREQLPRFEVSLLGKLGQVGPWAIEDPTGGEYMKDPDTEMFGPGLGPGESIAVASAWAASAKPRGVVPTLV